MVGLPRRTIASIGSGVRFLRTETGETSLLEKTLIALLLASLVGVVSGCNTIAGAGKDIERGGQTIRDAAKDVQRKM
jgi:entericidin B